MTAAAVVDSDSFTGRSLEKQNITWLFRVHFLFYCQNHKVNIALLISTQKFFDLNFFTLLGQRH